ncbi:unnamed protein product [Rotaria magnacalcarata]|uniref:Uncharacterized protein n=1 Tax=Rotaria magnacalcarata TaxID=392030 RepID=A0A816Q093_9BILA|nr:unnamed protein product [Rotaria magnacalcarata]CAF2054456.1 unnamed protein product [Rotaria magnacalcarata]
MERFTMTRIKSTLNLCCGFQGEVKFQLTYSSGGAIDATTALREVHSIFHQQIEDASPYDISYGITAANLYEPPPPSYESARSMNNHFAETTMYVSQSHAPYEGVYQRQPTGLPKAEFTPQYPTMSDVYQTHFAYQNNGFGGQINEKQNYQMPPSYEQALYEFQEKKHA